MLRQLAHWLIEPSAHIQERDLRRQATLLAAFLLGLVTLIIIIEALTVALIDWANYTGYRQSLAAAALLAVAYGISRTRHVQVAALLAIAIAVLAVFVTGLVEPRSAVTGLLDYLILPLWLSSLYIDLRRLSILITISLLGLLAIPFISAAVPLNGILIGPFSFILMTSLLLLLITYHRNGLEHDRQADQVILLERVQRTNAELSLAYESTIEGWSRALDLRDKETEGHSRRVTDLTLSLARAVGIGEPELVHIRRGALLHDIGKMGIPDRILLKEGPLTADEWDIMRLHPVYAYDMLLPIEHLRPALDIPYFHHEKWDGSGYPHGLSGEQIPLAARIFALVDVWDALTSDRPYRKAWPQQQAGEHIRAHAGTHFDPKLVEPFLGMLAFDRGSGAGIARAEDHSLPRR